MMGSSAPVWRTSGDSISIPQELFGWPERIGETASGTGEFEVEAGPSFSLLGFLEPFILLPSSSVRGVQPTEAGVVNELAGKGVFALAMISSVEVMH